LQRTIQASTDNEIRQTMGDVPITGDLGDQIYKPINVIPAEQAQAIRDNNTDILNINSKPNPNDDSKLLKSIMKEMDFSEEIALAYMSKHGLR